MAHDRSNDLSSPLPIPPIPPAPPGGGGGAAGRRMRAAPLVMEVEWK